MTRYRIRKIGRYWYVFHPPRIVAISLTWGHALVAAQIDMKDCRASLDQLLNASNQPAMYGPTREDGSERTVLHHQRADARTRLAAPRDSSTR